VAGPEKKKTVYIGHFYTTARRSHYSRRCAAMAFDKTRGPSIQQYNVSHSDVIIQGRAIVLITFQSLNSIPDVMIRDALEEHKSTALLRG
jgi:predicted metalloenzyme YecM